MSGKPQRSMRSRPDLKFGQRDRILSRDSYRCALCGRGAPDVILNVGHIMPVATGRADGWTDSELFDDENLLAQCEECNHEQGVEPLPPRLVLRLILWRIRAGRQC